MAETETKYFFYFHHGASAVISRLRGAEWARRSGIVTIKIGRLPSDAVCCMVQLMSSGEEVKNRPDRQCEEGDP